MTEPLPRGPSRKGRADSGSTREITHAAQSGASSDRPVAAANVNLYGNPREIHSARSSSFPSEFDSPSATECVSTTYLSPVCVAP